MMEDVITFFVGLFFGISIGALIIISCSQSNKTIVRHGCAQYNNITGDFEWIENDNN